MLTPASTSYASPARLYTTPQSLIRIIKGIITEKLELSVVDPVKVKAYAPVAIAGCRIGQNVRLTLCPD